MSRTLQAGLVTADGKTSLVAPVIGVFTPSVRRGDVLAPGSPIGRLVTTGVARTIVALDDGVWRVVAPAHPSRLTVQWGAPLVTVEHFAAGASEEKVETARPDGGVAFESPMEGQFYRRSSPDVPAFAEPGQIVRPGDTIGLIEVMKFFYPLTFSGADAAEILSFEAVDGRPVEAGATVAWYRPVGAETE